MSKAKYIIATVAIIAVIIVGVPFVLHKTNISDMAIEHFYKNMEDARVVVASQQKNIIKNLIKEGKYRCCINNPCSYCFLKSTGSEDGTVCDCLDEIVNGEHPCGECIGEILEGNGNKYLSEYFTDAIVDELGSEYYDTVKSIIESKYSVS